jgi:hypothetical protein
MVPRYDKLCISPSFFVTANIAISFETVGKLTYSERTLRGDDKYLTPHIIREASKYFLSGILPPFTSTRESWLAVQAETVDLIVEDEMFPASESPRSGYEFACKFDRFFSQTYLDRLRETFLHFDHLVGEPVSTDLLQNETYAVWAKILVASIFSACYDLVVQGPEPAGIGSTSIGSIRSTLSRLSKLRKRPGIPQFDGPGEEENDDPEEPSEAHHALASSQAQDAPATEEGHYLLHQIELKGATISEAWRSNDQVRSFGLSYPIPATWTPATSSGFDVFHGTSAPLKEPLENFRNELSVTPFMGLALMQNENQTMPGVNRYTYTAFSAFRCFLWAAFKNAVEDVPDPGTRALLAREWKTGGNSYRGPVLFHFRSGQPTVGDLTAFVLQPGSEEAWYRAVRRYAHSHFSKDVLWCRPEFRNIHGQESTQWPDVIHSLEFKEAEARLQPYVRNLWRSTWCSEAALQELRQRHVRTYAISFELVPKVSKDDKVAKDKGSDKKGRDKKSDDKKGSDKKGSDKKGSDKKGSDKKDGGSWGRKSFGRNILRKLKTTS